MTDVEEREVLGSLIVGLDGGQFISELLATVELPDFREVNFGEPMLHFGVLLIGNHAVSQLPTGGDMRAANGKKSLTLDYTPGCSV